MPDLDRYLDEDLDHRGDATTQALFGSATSPARARIVARERLVLAGVPEAGDVFSRFGVTVVARAREGDRVPKGATLLDLRGPLGGILTAERLALNLLGRMSGIATETRRLQDIVRRANPRCRVAGTRKTTPGFRAEEKRAIALGGGDPHRYGLYDMILVKDNHLAALGGDVAEATRRAVAYTPRLPVQVEVTTVAQARAAADSGADWILIDNQTPARARRMAEAARAANPRVLVEASGRLTPETLAAYAPFCDRLSMGALTHSARSADVALDLVMRRTA